MVDQVIDRRVGYAVCDQLVAGESDLVVAAAALDDAVAEPQQVEELDAGADLERFGGRCAEAGRLGLLGPRCELR